MARSMKGGAKANIFKKYGRSPGPLGNLWLVYSYKMNRDFAFSSDIQLLHWVCWLETNTDVAHFEYLDKESREDPDGAFRLRTGGVKHWRISTTPDSSTRNYGLNDRFTQTLIVTPKEIIEGSGLGMRYLAAMSFSAAIRGQELTSVENRVSWAERSTQRGRVSQLLTSVSSMDESLVAGIVVRHMIRGEIHLDMSQKSFGRQTEWYVLGSNSDGQDN